MHISKSTQRFSGTDLSTNHLTETGVVFPLASAINKPNFAGIMEHRGGKYQQNMLARCEYRIANGTIDSEAGTSITYAKGRCASFVLDPTTSTSSLSEQLAGITPATASYAALDELPATSLETPLLTEIIKLWSREALQPITDFIIENNIVQKVYPTKVQSPLVNTSTPVNTPAEDTLDSYLAAGRSIKWLTPVEIMTISLQSLQKHTNELSAFFYGDEDEEEERLGSTREETIKEYNFLREWILLSLKETEEELIEDAKYLQSLEEDTPEEELDEEDMYMLTMLLQAGVPTANITTPTEILNAYCALTTKGT